MYDKNNPKWVQADDVVEETSGYVTVKAYGETFSRCKVGWSNPFFDKTKSDVLVQNSRGDWLKVWFFDKDIAR